MRDGFDDQGNRPSVPKLVGNRNAFPSGHIDRIRFQQRAGVHNRWSKEVAFGGCITTIVVRPTHFRGEFWTTLLKRRPSSRPWTQFAGRNRVLAWDGPLGDVIRVISFQARTEAEPRDQNTLAIDLSKNEAAQMLSA